MSQSFLDWLQVKYSNLDEKATDSKGPLLAKKYADKTLQNIQEAASEGCKGTQVEEKLKRIFNDFPTDFIPEIIQEHHRQFVENIKPNELSDIALSEKNQNKLRNFIRFNLLKLADQVFKRNPVTNTLHIKDQIWKVLGIDEEILKKIKAKISEDELNFCFFQALISNIFLFSLDRKLDLAIENNASLKPDQHHADPIIPKKAIADQFRTDLLRDDDQAFIKSVINNTGKSFTSYLFNYYESEQHTPKSNDHPITESRNCIHKILNSDAKVYNPANLTRVLNCFPPFFGKEESDRYDAMAANLQFDIKVLPPSKDADTHQWRSYYKKKITNYDDIKDQIEKWIRSHLHHLFKTGPDQTINLKPEIAKILGINETLLNKIGKTKALKYIYSSFVNNFLLNAKKPLPVIKDEAVRKEEECEKDRAFSIIANQIAEETVTDLFEPYVPFSERARDSFDYVYNHGNEYSSRTAAFFGWKPPYFTALVETPLNLIRGVTEYIPSLVKNFGDKLIATANYEEAHNRDATLTKVAGYAIKGVGWLWHEVGMTITSPWKAANETYDWVSKKVGGTFGKVLGFIAGGIRMLPAVVGATIAIVSTCGLAAPIIGTAKAGFMATMAAKIQYGLGWLGGWIGSKLGLSITAKAAGSALANVTVASVPTTVCVTAIGSNVLANTATAAGRWCSKTIADRQSRKVAPVALTQSPSSLDIIDYNIRRTDWKDYAKKFQARGVILDKSIAKTAAAFDADLAKLDETLEKEKAAQVKGSPKLIKDMLSAAASSARMSSSSAVVGSGFDSKSGKPVETPAESSGPPAIHAPGTLGFISPPALPVGGSASPTASQQSTSSSSGGTPPVAPSTPELSVSDNGRSSPHPVTPNGLP